MFAQLTKQKSKTFQCKPWTLWLTKVKNVKHFNDNYNVFKIDFETKEYASFKGCHKRNGAVVSMKNKNRRAIIEKLKELDMEKTDFKALPFYSLLSFHDS